MKHLKMKSVIKASLAVGMIALLSAPIIVLAHDDDVAHPPSKLKSGSESFSGYGFFAKGMGGTSNLRDSNSKYHSVSGVGIGAAVESTKYGRKRTQYYPTSTYYIAHGHADAGLMSVALRSELVGGVASSNSGLGVQVGTVLNMDLSSYWGSQRNQKVGYLESSDYEYYRLSSSQNGGSFTPSLRAGLIYDLNDINSFVTLSGVLAVPFVETTVETGVNLTVANKKGFLSVTGTKTLANLIKPTTNVNVTLATTVGTNGYFGAYVAVNRRVASKYGWDDLALAGRSDSNNLTSRTEIGGMIGGTFR